jgi:hypothetical protein
MSMTEVVEALKALRGQVAAARQPVGMGAG